LLDKKIAEPRFAGTEEQAKQLISALIDYIEEKDKIKKEAIIYDFKSARRKVHSDYQQG
jgi:hypothetical protein